jgi:hypothetical protein
MEQRLVGTLEHNHYKAEIYSTDIPGEFKVRYRKPNWKVIHEVPLTGISSYKQREHEIEEQLHRYAHGVKEEVAPDLEDAGEY